MKRGRTGEGSTERRASGMKIAKGGKARTAKGRTIVDLVRVEIGPHALQLAALKAPQADVALREASGHERRVFGEGSSDETVARVQ